MQDASPSPSAARVAAFWNDYLKLLEAERVPERARPWYRRRVEAYLEAYPDLRLRAHNRQQVGDYLHVLGRNTALADWQFRQSVDALRILFVRMLAAAWADEVD